MILKTTPLLHGRNALCAAVTVGGASGGVTSLSSVREGEYMSRLGDHGYWPLLPVVILVALLALALLLGGCTPPRDHFGCETNYINERGEDTGECG